MNPFCHLHVHSQYSILDGSLSLKALVQRAKALNMPAVALTDHGNLFGAVEFYKAAKEEKIHPVFGCEMAVAATSRFEKKKGQRVFHLTLLAENKEGFSNLCTLSSKGYTEGFYFVPRIDFDLLKSHCEGIICLTGCMKGPLGQLILEKQEKELEDMLSRLQSFFPNRLYIELHRLHSSQHDIELDGMREETWLFQQYQDFCQKQAFLEKELVSLHKRHGIPLVATNNCHYMQRDDWKAHEVLINIQSGEPCLLKQIDHGSGQSYTTPNPKRDTFPTHEFYFKTQEEMNALFHDLPEALKATADIAERCHFSFDFNAKHYPVFYPPTFEKSASIEERQKESARFLQELCHREMPTRYTEEELKHIQQLFPDKDPMKVVEERLSFELEIINSKSLVDYLLIVWDFIHWAKTNGIPMGPGRGSGVGSIILYLIGITDIEPIRFHLFFERFINPGRFSYPDIDVDICMDRRGELIDYTIRKYGRENVAQIITFGTMKAKMSVKDVGRVLNIPLSKVNQIAKLIPDDLNMTLDKALETDADLKQLYETDSETKQILDIAQTLEGSIRNTGIHAAGIVISGEELTEHIPVCLAKESDMCVTQYSMKPLEQVGMLKIDFLGLKTLTSIHMCCEAIKRRFQTSIRWEKLPLDDKKTFSLFHQGKTLGIFQVESGGMQDLVKQLHPDRFEEIIAVVALYRPGPMDMIPSFIARKHGREEIEYDHPWIQAILEETYGIMVYQEQVMQIAQQLANYSLGEGDVLRRAMGKKNADEMAGQKIKFVQGAKANGIEEEIALRIFEKMEKFAQYGFNKSHATAYGYITYVTAYLKANYPGEWMASLMTCAKDDTEKVAKFMHEASSLAIPCLPPDINESDKEFRATDKGIRFALSAIKGVGEQVVDTIVQERTKKGPFASFHDFLFRIDKKKVGKKTVELLIDAGSFDCFGIHRDHVLGELEMLFDEASKRAKEKEGGILHLFEESALSSKPSSNKPPTRSKEDLLLREKQLLGIFVSDHPLRLYSDPLKLLGALSIQEMDALPTGSVFRLAFLIESCAFKISSKSGKKFAILRILDIRDESIELPIWSDLLEKNLPLLKENKMLWAICTKEGTGESSSIQCKWLGDLKTFSPETLEKESLAYDTIRRQLNRFRKKDPSPSSKDQSVKETKAKEPPPPLPHKKIALQFDLSLLRASHMIELKKRLDSSPGDRDIVIRFLANENEVAEIPLASNKKVRWTRQLLKELESISSFAKSIEE